MPRLRRRICAPHHRRKAAHVCWRWHECAHVPEFCSSVRCIGLSDVGLQSLLAWLLRHGRHVRRMELDLAVDSDRSNVMSCCFGTCAATGQLEELKICTSSGSELLISAWAHVLTRLRRLDVVGQNEYDKNPVILQLDADISLPAALRQLYLEAGDYGDVRLLPGARLPPALEELSMVHCTSDALPAQARLRGEGKCCWWAGRCLVGGSCTLPALCLLPVWPPASI